MSEFNHSKRLWHEVIPFFLISTGFDPGEGTCILAHPNTQRSATKQSSRPCRLDQFDK